MTTPTKGTDHFITLRGLRFHYVSWGRADAPVLITLHGLRSYAETFDELATALLATHRVISLDQRGRGKSDWDPQQDYQTLNYVADLAALADALQLDRFSLLGHSMGGANAIVYAAEHPGRVERLIVEDNGPGASASSAGADRIKRELASTPERFADWASARAFWRSIRPNVTEAAIDSRVEYSLKEESGQVVWRHDQAGIAAARLRIPSTDLWPYAERLRCPVLLLRGEHSDFLAQATAEAMTQRLPNVTHVPIAGAGHYIHDDQPAAFIAAVQDFLARPL